ncbi:MAG: CDP-alcohol phosphatidyltransferase family protein [Anaerolineae bacterium]
MANLITLSRFPLLILILFLLFYAGPTGQLACTFLILLLILLDTVDGMVARRRRETSLLGSALDIATDRAVELVLWVSFASLGLIPLLIPLVVIIRGTLTDSIRAVASSHGVRAFDMSRSAWARFLVASPAMRTSYGAAKAVAFCTLALWLGLQNLGLETPAVAVIRFIALASSWAAVVLCVARGVPVLVEAPAFFRQYSTTSKQG